MLTCCVCLQRCVRRATGVSTPSLSPVRTPIALTQSGQTSRRNYNSSASSRVLLKPNLQYRPRPYDYQKALSLRDPQFDVVPALIPISESRDAWLKARGIRPEHMKGHVDKQKQLARHNGALRDPLKLAEYVLKLLQQDDFLDAVDLVRTASKDVQCTVSWNHLIDHQLKNGKMNGAIKIYNEMKKRTQLPDSHTYTIILRGCAEHPDAERALEKVLAIYHVLLTDKSPVKANTIHMNAVLRMCAKAQNLDALFTIMEQMPATGKRSPDNFTYTILLNALRSCMGLDTHGLTTMQKGQNIRKATMDGRRIWEDVRERWNRGELFIDEALVCEMGRLLLFGDDGDRDDIFSLLEQTMNIPRQIPRRWGETRQITEPENQEPIKPVSLGVDETSIIESQSTSLYTANNFEPIQTEQSLPPQTSRALTISLGTYAKPGRNTLSLVLEALTPLQNKEAAVRYWNIFTNDIGVYPDRANYGAYLRILREARASTEACALVQQIPSSEMGFSLFTIAMSACERDKLSPNTFANAGKILDVMQTSLSAPSVRALYSYIKVAISAPPSLENVTFGGDIERSKLAKGRQILRALERIKPAFDNIKSLIAYGDPTKSEVSATEKFTFLRQVELLARRMIGAYDQLISASLVERWEVRGILAEKRKMSAFLMRLKRRLMSHESFVEDDRQSTFAWNTEPEDRGKEDQSSSVNDAASGSSAEGAHQLTIHRYSRVRSRSERRP